MRLGSLFIRGAFIGAGLGAILWSSSVLPLFENEKSLIRVANAVRRGEGISIEQVDAIDSTFAARSRQMRSSMHTYEVIAELPSLQRAVESDAADRFQAKAAEVERQTRLALSRAPGDSFLWLMLFWLRTLQAPASAEDFQYLRMSYAFGPNEGWVAERRNALVMNAFSEMPPDLADLAISELVRLIRSNLIIKAAEIAAGPGWAFRDAWLNRISDVPEAQRQAFAKELSKRRPEFVMPGRKPDQQEFWR